MKPLRPQSPGLFGQGITTQEVTPRHLQVPPTALATTGPNFVHQGIEVWQLPLVEYRIKLPDGARLKRITGNITIAPVPGWRPDSGLVRQTLVWCFPALVPVGPPSGVSWVVRPDGVKIGAHGELDCHFLCENLKVVDSGQQSRVVNQDFGNVGVEVPGGLLVLFVANQTGKGDDVHWENDLRRAKTPDTEGHLWFWW